MRAGGAREIRKFPSGSLVYTYLSEHHKLLTSMPITTSTSPFDVRHTLDKCFDHPLADALIAPSLPSGWVSWSTGCSFVLRPREWAWETREATGRCVKAGLDKFEEVIYH